MYLVFAKSEVPDSQLFWTSVERSARSGLQVYEAARRALPFQTEDVLEEMRALLAASAAKPKRRRACYFLAACAGCCEQELQAVWERNGSLESFKGTLMHKQAELYVQELGAWQLEQGRSHVTVREMQSLPHVLERARAAATPSAALKAVAATTRQELWEHPATQKYLSFFLSEGSSEEFRQLENWILRQSSLSPFRAEWSIYDEDAAVAGQVDSLWFDEDEGAVVMVDWKRARELLTSDLETQSSQAFGAKGRASCDLAPAYEGPCASMFDCSYNHYKMQQHIYADFLGRKYNVRVARMLLVQCHPELKGCALQCNEAEISQEPELAARALAAFKGGWCECLKV
jgi:hypothetical protein